MRITLKKYSEKELKTKMLMLKASNKFNDQLLRMIEAACKNTMQLELSENQVDFLKTMQMIEKEERGDEEQNVPDTNPNDVGNKATSNMPKKAQETIEEKAEEIVEEQEVPVEEADEVAEEVEEELREEVAEPINDGLYYEEPESSENSIEEEKNESIPENEEEHKISATVAIELEEEDEEIPEEFAPDKDADSKQIKDNKKMYYLTPDRVLETLKTMNNGSLWESLGRLPNGGEIQEQIESAYKNCIFYSEIMDPNFLDNKLRKSMPEGYMPIEMKGFHQAALMGTFVGYQVEKNGQDIDDVENDNPKGRNVAILKFPNMLEQMPNQFKNNVVNDLERAILDRVQDIMRTSNSYRALMILSPMDQTVDKAMEDYADSLGSSEEHQRAKAYIAYVRENRESEMKDPLNEMNYSIDLSGIDWNDPGTRKNVVALVEQLQGEAKDVNLPDFTEEIKMSFRVQSPRDLEAAEAACADLAQLSDEGIEVEIAFELPPRAASNPAIDEKLDSIVDKYDNIERSDEPVTISGAMNRAMNRQMDRQMEKAENFTRDVMIAGIIAGATELDDDLEHDREDEPEIARQMGGDNT